MGLIYESAFLTVIVVAREDADAGIPGISLRAIDIYNNETDIKTTQGPFRIALCRPSLYIALRRSY
jgi:hypothetical protein